MYRPTIVRITNIFRLDIWSLVWRHTWSERKKKKVFLFLSCCVQYQIIASCFNQEYKYYFYKWNRQGVSFWALSVGQQQQYEVNRSVSWGSTLLSTTCIEHTTSQIQAALLWHAPTIHKQCNRYYILHSTKYINKNYNYLVNESCVLWVVSFHLPKVH